MTNLTCPPTNASPSPAPQARLHGNIANPSSPELLHFLFGPLHVVRPSPSALLSPPAARGIRVPLLEGVMACPFLPLLADCGDVGRTPAGEQRAAAAPDVRGCGTAEGQCHPK